MSNANEANETQSEAKLDHIDSEESIRDAQDLEVIAESNIDLQDEYFKQSETQAATDFEIVSGEIPKAEHTQITLMNKFYNVLSLASMIPEFSESAGGILALFTEGTMTRCTYENILIAVATAISFNPAFAWWLLANGGIAASGVMLAVVEFSVMNPTKVIALYGISRKVPSMMRLYRMYYGEAC